jgi:hypothetical protein
MNFIDRRLHILLKPDMVGGNPEMCALSDEELATSIPSALHGAMRFLCLVKYAAQNAEN